MKTPRASSPHRQTHAYAEDLSRVVRQAWRERRQRGEVTGPVPPQSLLNELLSVAYQASLLREEGRSLTFRLVVASPARFDDAQHVPHALQRLRFSRARPLDPHELRRLAPATDYARSVIGVRLSRHGSRVWGLLHAGSVWPATVPVADLTRPLLVVSVSGPGHIIVTLNGAPLAELGNGRLGTSDVDVFEAPWMRQALGGLAATLEQGARSSDETEWAAGVAIDVLRQAVSLMRAEQHGGMLIVLPSTRVDAVRNRGALRLKYEFVAPASTPSLSVALRDRWTRMLAQSRGSETTSGQAHDESRGAHLRDADVPIMAVASLIAALSQVDGAVVLTDRLDVVGFGTEIAGRLRPVPRVAHAFDLAGVTRRWMRADRVGTRHRAAYRLCEAARDVLVLVVSQDGGLRVIRWHEDAVTYWSQVARGPWEG
jgi:hypothetical protein